MAHDVFISHSHDDKAIADAVCAILESDGLRCWIAPRDIRPGQTWGGSIFKAISESTAMVIILSRNANTSTHVMREVELAVKNQVVILPFRIDNSEPTEDLAYFLSSTHWLDALTPPREARIRELSLCLRGIVAERPKTSYPKSQHESEPAVANPSVSMPSDAADIEAPKQTSTARKQKSSHTLASDKRQKMIRDGETGTLIDIDGNIYKTVQIGNQIWMAENLKVTHYRNGDPIPNITSSDVWSKLENGAYCCYDNQLANAKTYGLLYNWYAVNDNRRLAPKGWHVPSDKEWQQLGDFLGGEYYGGGKLKEKGTSHWRSPNMGATDELGFRALPGGYRYYRDGSFDNLGTTARFWSSSESYSDHAWYRDLLYTNSDIRRYYYNWQYGFSVRCVRD
ncbi:MAG TPA: FISUMP domain-containing protein [bacterium]|nr:FISUMP domain-containing protein [bacterium]